MEISINCFASDLCNIKHAKVFIIIVKIYLNGEFIEVPLITNKTKTTI